MSIDAFTNVSCIQTEYGDHLTNFVLSPVGVEWPLRQLAGVLLKQYITHHWSPLDETNFIPPVVTPESKNRIKTLLLNALGQDCDLRDQGPEKKLKGAIAYAVSTIAHYDWPEEWPELFVTLVSYLSSGNKSAVYASMKVFVEVSHEVIDSQIPTVAPLVLPKMLEILRDPINYSLRTRGRAIQVFNYISETIGVMGEYDKVSVKTYLDPVLPHFMETLVHVLQEPYASDHVDIGLKKDTLNCITILLKGFHKRLNPWMPQILTSVWGSLTSCASRYVNSIVNSDAGHSTDEGWFDDVIVDSDGEHLGMETLIFSIFEFVSVLIETPKTRKMIKTGLTDLIYYIIIYMQVTDEQQATWSTVPDQFVDDEDDDSYAYSIRRSAQDVLLSLGTEFEENESKKANDAFKSSVVEAIKRHFSESSQQKSSASTLVMNNNSSRDDNYWKIQESCLFALGSLAPTYVDAIKSNESTAGDLKFILDNVFMSLNESNPQELNEFFVGRCLWTASRFSSIMSPPVLERLLLTTTNSLCSPSNVIKISAIRAIYAFADHLKLTERTIIMKPYLNAILGGLLNTGFKHSSEVLALVLETISVIIPIDDDFTAQNESKITPVVIATFIRYSSDPILICLTQDIFKQLSKNPQCIGLIETRLGPTLNSILNLQNSPQTVENLQPVALDILTSMVRASPLPLSDSLMQLFVSSVNCILRTSDDNSTLQNGGETIRAYVSKSTDQVMSFRDSESGRDGLSMVMQVCLHLLDPRVSETCSAFVGRLVSVTILRAGSRIGSENVHLLLRSVLSKLQQAETLSVIQSLIMVFAHLLNHEMQTVLDFLSSLPGPGVSSKSALEFVLTEWLSRQHLFFGTYENKVCLIALSKLLQHSIHQAISGDTRINLNQILVPGDPIISESSSGIKTRSKTKAGDDTKWTSVPVSVKILKLLLAEIYNIQESNETNAHNQSLEDDEDDDDDENGAGGNGDFGPDGDSCTFHNEDSCDGFEEDDEDDEDEDWSSDPIFKLNMMEYLMNFIKDFQQTEYFIQFFDQLNEFEKAVASTLCK